MTIYSYSLLVGLICVCASALVCKTSRTLSMWLLQLCLASCIAGFVLIVFAVLAR